MSARNEDYQNEFDFVMQFYGNDFNSSPLKTQLQLLTTSLNTYEQPTLPEIVHHFKSLSPAHRSGLSEICTLLKLVLFTIDNVPELMVLHVHKQRTDKLNLKVCVNEFVSRNEHRSETF